MKGPILVVLAAGMGSRYGGLKQIDKIGDGGEALLDYSVFDALRAGFEKTVFIIRRDIEKDFSEYVLARMKHKAPYELAFQELDSLIPARVLEAAKKAGRAKPWGTCHALLCAERHIDAPFAVINADDFYGREAYQTMAGFLKADGESVGAIVPYRLVQTLSPTGTVTRGVCAIEGGLLRAVEELKSIEKKDGVIFNTDENGEKRQLAPDTPVSMNFWGFPAGVLPRVREYFDAFLETSGGEPKSECYIPLAADWLIKRGFLEIRALAADSEWFGVTYKEDKDTAVKRVRELTEQGVYPKGLWR
jgi:NDP-sugar pyrophosphorylase family protein